MHKQSRMFPFVFGVILGILCSIFLPKYVRPYLPDFLMGKETIVKGTVLAKEKTGNALLLTVDTSQGALLASFTKKGDEVNLLVNQKDTVEFTLERYKPFIDNPKITRVIKAQEASSPEPAKVSATPAKPAEKNAKEVKPRNLRKTVPDLSASKSTTTDVQHQGRENAGPAPGDTGAEK
jgi:hypothetical protein